MDFDLISMLVVGIKLGPAPTSNESGTPSQLKLETSLDYNAADKQTVKLTSHVKMISVNNYELEADCEFYFRFKHKLSGDEAEKAIRDAKTESIVFPYLSAYLTNLLVSSGYPRPNIPLVLLD